MIFNLFIYIYFKLFIIIFNLIIYKLYNYDITDLTVIQTLVPLFQTPISLSNRETTHWVTQLVKTNIRKCGVNKRHMALDLNSVINDTLNLSGTNCCDQHPKIWIPVESFKDLTMKDFSVINWNNNFFNSISSGAHF